MPFFKNLILKINLFLISVALFIISQTYELEDFYYIIFQTNRTTIYLFINSYLIVEVK
jgi:hypothetical protein